MPTLFNTQVYDQAQAARASRAAEGFADGASIEGLFIDQLYGMYTEADHASWAALYEDQREHVGRVASKYWLDGAQAIGLSPDRVPRLSEVNSRLRSLTGWRSRAVPGYVSARPFFACLAQRTFPTTIVIRGLADKGYIPEPDIFHDVYGHVPLHAEPSFAEFLQEWGRASLRADESYTIRLARLFWFTVEFGLIREKGELKIYGAGILSSPDESRHALESASVERRPFDWRTVCETPFEIDHEQPILYVAEGFRQLVEGMRDCAREMDATQAKEHTP